MIVFKRFEIDTGMPEEKVLQKLHSFIDASTGIFSADLTKGYSGRITNNNFTLRVAYGKVRWYRERVWRSARVRDSRNFYDGYKGYGTISRGISGSTINVEVKLQNSSWIFIGLCFLFPVLASAWLQNGVGGSYFTFFWPALGITAIFVALVMLYHFVVARRAAGVMKRDLQALFDGTWQPLQPREEVMRK
jgi:hypothetical protein